MGAQKNLPLAKIVSGIHSAQEDTTLEIVVLRGTEARASGVHINQINCLLIILSF